MQVVSLAPVPVASVTWRLGSGGWSLGVICKLTFQLDPGDARLAKRHDPIYERDRFPDDDDSVSLYAPSDLVPTRLLTDVTLVGNAYAPRGNAVTSLTARMQVQTIDKSLVIDSRPTPRAKAFKSAPLTYELAEPSPTNPLGMERDAPNNSHPIHIVAAIDPSETSPGHTSPGFGPIPERWPSRRGLSGGDPPRLEEGRPYNLPKGFDMKFFNAAPPDQQLPELPPNAEIGLMNLHPDEPVLNTRLPNVAPQVFVERKGDKRVEQEASISSLWIDTRRSVATLCWHAQVRLEAADEPGRVWVAVAGPGSRLSANQLGRLIGSLSRSSAAPPPPPRRSADPVDEDTSDESQDPMNQTISIRKADRKKIAAARGDEVTKTSVLSEDHLIAAEDTERARRKKKGDTDVPRATSPRRRTASGGSTPPSANGKKSRPKSRPPRPRKSQPPKAPPKDHLADVIDPSERTADGIRTNALDDAPAWLSQRDGSAAAPPAKRSRPASAPPPSSIAAMQAEMNPLPGPRPPAVTHPGLGPTGPNSTGGGWPTTHVQPGRDNHLGDTAGLPAAGPPKVAPGAVPNAPNPVHQAPSSPRPADPAPEAKPKPKPKPKPKEVVELLWFDQATTPRLRRRWTKLCDELDFAPKDDDHDLVTDDPTEARQHHTHFGVLTQVRPGTSLTLREALRDAISESGRFTPPLVVLAGELRFPFDAIEVLRATASTVKPVAGDDKKLKAALEQVDELLQTPLLSGNTDTVANFTKHLRKLYGESRRSLSVSYLDDTVERMLLEQRQYQKRTLFGGPSIRALLLLEGSDKGIPTYLPEELADKLPMMTSLATRVIAEGHVRQDQYEAHPHALKVVTLGRVIRLEST